MAPKIKLQTTMAFYRICGFAALGFAFLIVLVNVFLVPAGFPHTGAETGEVIAFFTTNKDIIGLASTLTPIAWVLATLFGAGAVSVLWPSERERGEAWSLVRFGGLILQNGTFTAVIALRLALASTTAHDSTTTAGLWALHDALFTLNGTFLALTLIGFSISGLLSAVLLFSSATLTPLIINHASPLSFLGLVGWLMWVVWILTYGITLIRCGNVPVES